MADAELKHVTIIGVGLLGGSIGLALKARLRGVVIAGVGRRKKSLDEALSVGAIDTAHLDAAEVVSRSGLVVLATPVGAFRQHLESIKPLLKRGALVTDVGSTKGAVVRIAERVLGRGGPFVGSHPMAGSDRKGVRFARADLFVGATCIVTATAATLDRRLGQAERFWRGLGMSTVRMTPSEHDRAMARVSHLPHALAGLMMMLPGKGDLPLAATGFRDATRLAGGDPEMWRDILLTNRRAILNAIDAFDEDLMHLRDLVDLSDAAGIEKFLTAAKKRRSEAVKSATPKRRMQRHFVRGSKCARHENLRQRHFPPLAP